MELFFESEKSGRTRSDLKPLRASYADQHGKSDFIFTHFDDQLTGKKETFLNRGMLYM